MFCLEQADNNAQLFRVALPEESGLAASLEKDLLGGVITIHGQAEVEDATGWDAKIYSPLSPSSKPIAIKAIPYYSWDNREPGQMIVWMRSTKKA